MYMVKNGLAPQYISELFHAPHKGYKLRNADLNIPRLRTVRYINTLYASFDPSYKVMEQTNYIG